MPKKSEIEFIEEEIEIPTKKPKPKIPKSGKFQPQPKEKPVDHGPITAVHRRVSSSGDGVAVFTFADGEEEQFEGVSIEDYSAYEAQAGDFAPNTAKFYKSLSK